VSLEDEGLARAVKVRFGYRTNLESRLGLDLLHHGVRQRLVKLQGRGEVNDCVLMAKNMGSQTCWRTFMANWGVIAPLVISSSRESVRAIPILLNQLSYERNRLLRGH